MISPSTTLHTQNAVVLSVLVRKQARCGDFDATAEVDGFKSLGESLIVQNHGKIYSPSSEAFIGIFPIRENSQAELAAANCAHALRERLNEIRTSGAKLVMQATITYGSVAADGDTFVSSERDTQILESTHAMQVTLTSEIKDSIAANYQNVERRLVDIDGEPTALFYLHLPF